MFSRTTKQSGPKVLIVDDMEDIRVLLRALLVRRFPEVEIIESSSGMKAGVELAKTHFDLVVSDAEMADGNGLWLHYFMEQYHQQIPLIFFTARPEQLFQLSSVRKIVSKANIDSLLNEIEGVLPTPS